jgi:hypothetical protein
MKDMGDTLGAAIPKARNVLSSAIPKQFDPDLFKKGGIIAELIIKGTPELRNFSKFSDVIVAKLGDKAAKYLMSWYGNARVSSPFKDQLQTEAQAQEIFNSKYPTLAIEEDETPISPRPPVRIARPEFIPKPTQNIGKATYQATSGIVLDKDQVLGVNLMIDHFRNTPEGGAFLLADGPGFGKTMQALAIIDQYSKLYPGSKNLIITQNKQIAETRFAVDALAMGIDPKSYTITTFTSVASLPQQEWGLIVFDEAHNLKNPESGKSLNSARLESKHKVFATATPMDRVTGASYFLSEITGMDEAIVAERLGYTLKEKIQTNGEVSYIPTLVKGMDWAKVKRNIQQFRDASIVAGAMIRREFPFFGTVQDKSISMSSEHQKDHKALVDHFDELIADAGSFYGQKIAGQKVLTIARWSEQAKIDTAIKMTLEALKAGRQVLIICDTVGEQRMPIKVTGSVLRNGKELRDARRGAAYYLQPAAQQITEALKKAGITNISKIYGTGIDKKAEIGKFQSGQYKVAIGTVTSAGTGIDADDSKGIAPRTLICLTKTFAGDAFEQLIGRVSRRYTMTPAEVYFLSAGTYSDNKKDAILSRKMDVLLAIQGGGALDDNLIEESGGTDEVLNAAIPKSLDFGPTSEELSNDLAELIPEFTPKEIAIAMNGGFSDTMLKKVESLSEEVQTEINNWFEENESRIQNATEADWFNNRLDSLRKIISPEGYSANSMSVALTDNKVAFAKELVDIVIDVNNRVLPSERLIATATALSEAGKIAGSGYADVVLYTAIRDQFVARYGNDADEMMGYYLPSADVNRSAYLLGVKNGDIEKGTPNLPSKQIPALIQQFGYPASISLPSGSASLFVDSITGTEAAVVVPSKTPALVTAESAPKSINQTALEIAKSFVDSEKLSAAIPRRFSPTVRSKAAELIAQGGRALTPQERIENNLAIDRELPVIMRPLKEVLDGLPSNKQILDALGTKGIGKVYSKTPNPSGALVETRQDVPSQTRRGVGVVTTTLFGKGNPTYTAFIRLLDPVLDPSPREQATALQIQAGAKDKGPHIKIIGKVHPDQSIPKDLNTYTRVGYNPDRHTYYYLKDNHRIPIISGSELVQIGNDVFVKDAKLRNADDFLSSAIPKLSSKRYLELAKNPEANRKELQGIVDDAAKKAGLIPGWHAGGPANGSEVIGGKIRTPFHYLTSLENANSYDWKPVSKWYFSLKNPLKLSEHQDQFIDRDGTPNDMKLRIESAIKKVKDSMDAGGHDGLMFPTETGYPGYDYIVFDPSQIKASDPVTYDANGKVIPIEERFNLKSDEVLYSAIPRPVKEAADVALQKVQRAYQGILSLVSPSNMGAGETKAAYDLREKIGISAKTIEQIRVKYEPFWMMFNEDGVEIERPDSENAGIQFMDARSKGEPVAEKYQLAAEAFKKDETDLVDQYVKAGGKISLRDHYQAARWTAASHAAYVQALIEAKASGLIDDSFDPNGTPADISDQIRARVKGILKESPRTDNEATEYISKQSLEGRKTFKMQKTFDTIEAGRSFGLELISNNPVEIQKILVAEMARAILGASFIQKGVAEGRFDFVCISTLRLPTDPEPLL